MTYIIEVLRQEHRNIESLLCVLERELSVFDRGDRPDYEVVRAVMAVRIQDLSKGRAGVRLATLEALVNLLNSGVVPLVPEKGSVGASGDLAPMAHLALVLIGKGEAFHAGARVSGAQALAAAGLPPVHLEAGEGLALINGTQVMAAITALAVHDAERLAKTADIACSISLEVLMGTNVEFDPRIHAARPHPGRSRRRTTCTA